MSYQPNNPIAFIDSGIGGLSLLSECVFTYPNNYIYIADTHYMPYGNKSTQFLQERRQILTSFAQSQKSSYIVYACNTLCTLDKEPNLTSLQQIDIVDQLVDKALQQTKNNRIGIIGTQQTIASNHFKEKIKHKSNDVYIQQQGCPDLAQAIELQADSNRLEQLVHYYLSNILKQDIDTLILGCTHYPLIKDIFSTLAPDLKLIYNDAQMIKDVFAPAVIAPSIDIFTTGNKNNIATAIAHYLPRLKPFIGKIGRINI